MREWYYSSYIMGVPSLFLGSQTPDGLIQSTRVIPVDSIPGRFVNRYWDPDVHIERAYRILQKIREQLQRRTLQRSGPYMLTEHRDDVVSGIRLFRDRMHLKRDMHRVDDISFDIHELTKGERLQVMDSSPHRHVGLLFKPLVEQLQFVRLKKK